MAKAGEKIIRSNEWNDIRANGWGKKEWTVKELNNWWKNKMNEGKNQQSVKGMERMND